MLRTRVIQATVNAVCRKLTIGAVLEENKIAHDGLHRAFERCVARHLVSDVVGETPLIEAKDLHTFYDESHILRGVSLTLARGEALGLMGRNGMGKTTLIRTIMGLVRPRAGRVLIAGEDVTRAAAFRIAQRGIAYVPEGRGIFTSLTVRENLQIAERPGLDGANAWTMARMPATSSLRGVG